MADQDKMEAQPGQETALDLDPVDTQPGQETVNIQPSSTSKKECSWLVNLKKRPSSDMIHSFGINERPNTFMVYNVKGTNYYSLIYKRSSQTAEEKNIMVYVYQDLQRIRFQIAGQPLTANLEQCVNNFVSTFEPPLIPADIKKYKYLRDQSWYIGETKKDDALNRFKKYTDENAFLVYTPSGTDQHTLMYKRIHEEIENVQSLAINCSEGKYTIAGQTESFDSVVEAVEEGFIKTFESSDSKYPLVPIYTPSNTPLCCVLCFCLLGLFYLCGLGCKKLCLYCWDNCLWDMFCRDEQWHYHGNHHRCHPLNVCHGCWYRYGQENVLYNFNAIYRQYRFSDSYPYSWLNPCRSGPLRAMLLTLLWLFFCPCIACGYMIWVCKSLCTKCNDPNGCFGDDYD